MTNSSFEVINKWNEKLTKIVDDKFQALTDSIQELDDKEELLARLGLIKQKIGLKLSEFIDQEDKLYAIATRENNQAKIKEVIDDLALVEDLLKNASPDVFLACYNRTSEIKGSPLIKGLLVVGCLLGISLVVTGLILIAPSVVFLIPITAVIGAGLMVLGAVVFVTSLNAFAYFTRNDSQANLLEELANLVEQNLEIQQLPQITPGAKFRLFAVNPEISITLEEQDAVEWPDVGEELTELPDDDGDYLVQITL